MSALDVIDNAIALVERGWTQFSFARDSEGEPCGSYSAKACQWCLEGALKTETREELIAVYVVRELCRAEGFRTIDMWNDAPDRKQSHALILLNRVRVILLSCYVEVDVYTDQIKIVRKQ